MRTVSLEISFEIDLVCRRWIEVGKFPLSQVAVDAFGELGILFPLTV